MSSTPADDPNRLLGRPNGYTSRATFEVAGLSGDAVSTDTTSCDRGGCIEAWPDGPAAQRRADYISEIGKSLPAAVEYTYVRDDGLLLRVSSTAVPEQAENLRAAFEAL